MGLVAAFAYRVSRRPGGWRRGREVAGLTASGAQYGHHLFRTARHVRYRRSRPAAPAERQSGRRNVYLVAAGAVVASLLGAAIMPVRIVAQSTIDLPM